MKFRRYSFIWLPHERVNVEFFFCLLFQRRRRVLTSRLPANIGHSEANAPRIPATWMATAVYGAAILTVSTPSLLNLEYV